MLLLTSASDKIQIITSSAADLSVHASYADHTTTAFTPGRQNTAIASAATTDVVSPPDSGQRQIKTLTVRNKHAATSNTVTVQHTDGTTDIELMKVTLRAGECLQFVDGEGFTVFDSNGSRKIGGGPGRFIARQILTSGTSFTVSSETRKIKYHVVGGGGGGAGAADAAAAETVVGSGGSSGAEAWGLFDVTPGASYSYTIGAAGAGGAAGDNDGTAGGNTTLTVGGTTVTAPGGPGAANIASGTSITIAGAPTGAATATNGDINRGGEAGGPSTRLSGTVGYSGYGGSSTVGSGGAALSGQGNGENATGYGAGGSGGLSENGGTSASGGNGTQGVIIIDEYS